MRTRSQKSTYLDATPSCTHRSTCILFRSFFLKLESATQRHITCTRSKCRQRVGAESHDDANRRPTPSRHSSLDQRPSLHLTPHIQDQRPCERLQVALHIQHTNELWTLDGKTVVTYEADSKHSFWAAPIVEPKPSPLQPSSSV